MKKKGLMPAKPIRDQQGISLIEVLIAMFILTFGALAISNLQTVSGIAISSSADHFRINELNQTIVEHLMVDSARAAAGEYNTNFSETQAPATAEDDIAKKINSWKVTMSTSIPRGETSIQCNTSDCTVGLRWYELSHDGVADQTFNVKFPI